jgi:hypothetical protein
MRVMSKGGMREGGFVRKKILIIIHKELILNGLKKESQMELSVVNPQSMAYQTLELPAPAAFHHVLVSLSVSLDNPH